jgi:hypothetical protein
MIVEPFAGKEDETKFKTNKIRLKNRRALWLDIRFCSFGLADS